MKNPMVNHDQHPHWLIAMVLLLSPKHLTLPIEFLSNPSSHNYPMSIYVQYHIHVVFPYDINHIV